VAPTHPEKGEWSIESGAISMKKSITRPISIPLINEDEKSVLMELWKKEDIRTDSTIIPAIRLMNFIWKRDLGLDLNVVTYNAQPTGPDSGFIEMVQKCTTLYNIEKYSKLSLLNYIIESNPEESVAVLRQRFINSCAAYAVITKLLGICDRHLDNIMMTDRGELFHIDYGYILGRDPKDKFIGLSEMRITDEMVNAIGGEQSASYQQFKDLCSELYNCLRRYTNTFEYLLMLLVETDPKVCGDWLTREKLYQEITKQFEPNSTYKEAEIRIYSRIDNSTSTASGYRWGVIDFFHKHNKEKTVRNAVSNTLSVTAKGTKNFLVGVWDYLTTTGETV
jgi:phosphatidylinositol kinase/protein kinase (PI-3  family)